MVSSATSTPLRPLLGVGILSVVLALFSACSSPPANAPLEGGYRRFDRASDVSLVYRTNASARSRTERPRKLPVVVPGGSWLEQDLESLLPAQEFVFYDPRARGRSSGPRKLESFSLARDVEDLEALRTELGHERMVLLGWGYDAALALRYSQAHPDRVAALVLVAPLPPRRDPYWQQFAKNLTERIPAQTLSRLNELRNAGLADRDPKAFCRELTRVYARAYCQNPNVVEQMKSDPCQAPNLDPERRAAISETLLAELGAWDWRPGLEGLTMPVLLVHGRDDPLPYAASVEYAEALPRAELVLLPATGHLPWLDAPEAFRDAVAEFLQRTSATDE